MLDSTWEEIDGEPRENALIRTIHDVHSVRLNDIAGVTEDCSNLRANNQITRATVRFTTVRQNPTLCWPESMDYGHEDE
jgi:hypothetical protein